MKSITYVITAVLAFAAFALVGGDPIPNKDIHIVPGEPTYHGAHFTGPRLRRVRNLFNIRAAIAHNQ